MMERSRVSCSLARVAAFFWIVWTSLSLSAWGKTWVFVSAATDKTLVVFELDAERGELIERSRLRLPHEPASIACRLDQSRLFVALRSGGSLAAVSFQPEDGTLRLINEVPAGDDPAHIALDPSGTRLVTAFYVAGKVSVHAILEDGRLSESPLQEFTTADKAHAVVFQPGSRRVYVPHTGSERIDAFDWDTQTRTLQPRDDLRFSTEPGTGPRHAVWLSDGRHLAVGNEQGSSLSLYLGLETGRLEKLATESTLPGDFNGPNSTAAVRRHPHQDLVYVANRGHQSIAVIGVVPGEDDGDWSLMRLQNIATEAVPRSFDVDPTGRWLVVAGEQSGVLAVHPLEDGGRRGLEPIQRIALGERLWHVVIATTP